MPTESENQPSENQPSDHQPSDHQPSDFSAGDAGTRRRRQIAVGAVGLAAVLGVSAYLITAQVTDRSDNTAARDAGVVGVLVPSSTPATEEAFADAVPSESPSTSPSASASESSKPAQAPKKSEPAATPTDSEKVKKEIQAARDKAEKDGYPLKRPLAQKGGTAPGFTQRTETAGGATIRVMSARGDLTGQREMQWAADDGEAVGDARCTQQFRFSAGDKGQERPTMLLCWRVSAGRSVVTLAVSPSGRPDFAPSVVIIDREWSRLG